MTQRAPIPVIDLFAGPGGLGEGFSSLVDPEGNRRFEIKVSIEKDEVAHRTLSLRALFRAFPDGKVPDCYYDYVKGKITRDQLFAHPDAAEEGKRALAEARCAELGKTPHQTIDNWIRKAVGDAKEWVLIGGPPCQAYSVAGRARMRGKGKEAFESDKRHFLYTEYLRIIRLFKPSVFVMENVKGMLNSKHGGSPIFDRILSDLRSPGDGSNYLVRSLVVDGNEPEPMDFLIEAEKYGVPQARHRVILFGVRSDLAEKTTASVSDPERFKLTAAKKPVSVEAALAGLPPLRSRLSQKDDSHKAWRSVLKSSPMSLKLWRSTLRTAIETEMANAWAKSEAFVSAGSRFEERAVDLGLSMPKELRDWLGDPNLGGVSQHETRSHMASDLHRYMFASCFARLQRYSPKLRIYPPKLLPDHENMKVDAIPFLDRFRVQLAHEPSSTVVSHICKDGHYYIHHDPAQCRSLTVREAARLQTFPDSYFFEGNRTQQYHQVGNAVPPWLARQIGQVVFDFIEASRS
jgi:DNA (cytosine-5)-methyltransferase 1